MSSSKCVYLCICFVITFAIASQSGHGTHKRNALSPQQMAQLIASQNPEKHTMVECAINDFIVIIQTRPDWAPFGQKRFVELVNDRYYDDAALFRAIDDFLVQFGLAATKVKREKWAGRDRNIPDDLHIDVPFTRGVMSFAGAGPDTRGTQMFFTLADVSTHLGKEPWEVPFGRVIYGDDALKSINKEYGDKVSQERIWKDGYEYLRNDFPNLSYIEYCRAINENEMTFYLQAMHRHGNEENNDNEDNMEQLYGDNANEDNGKHDLQEQLYGDNVGVEDGTGMRMFIIMIVGFVTFIAILICAVLRVLRKNPDKKN